MEYGENGSLRKYLSDNNLKNKADFKEKIRTIYQIIMGLYEIHEKKLIHKDLHLRNILKKAKKSMITDLGLCRPISIETTKKGVYGVLPYMAPEVLCGQPYSQASDIYSLGILMYEIISEQIPYQDNFKDDLLALKICKGLRPKFNIKVPQLLVDIIKKCLDANPLERPTISELDEIFSKLYSDILGNKEICLQIKDAEETNRNLLFTSTSVTTFINSNPQAFYSSRLLNFPNLPEPKNADDDDEPISGKKRNF